MEYYLGEIRMFAGTFAPINWHLCDGTVLSITEYSALYSLIGAAWGGNGTTTFALPDLRGRIPIGQGTGTGLTPRTLGQMSGAETVTLTDVTMLPGHNHLIAAAASQADMAAPSNVVNLAKPPAPAANYLPPSKLPNPVQNRDMAASAVETVGGVLSHNNVMPSFAVNFIICTDGGLYPVRS
jgi:Microcystin-dependent protein